MLGKTLYRLKIKKKTMKTNNKSNIVNFKNAHKDIHDTISGNQRIKKNVNVNSYILTHKQVIEIKG